MVSVKFKAKTLVGYVTATITPNLVRRIDKLGTSSHSASKAWIALLRLISIEETKDVPVC